MLSPADLLHGLTSRHMNDHDGHVSKLGVADGAVCRFALDRLRPRDRVVIGRGVSGSFKPVRHEANCIVSFAMNHHQRPAAAGPAEHPPTLPRIEPQGVGGYANMA